MVAGLAEAVDIVSGAELSRVKKFIFALPSRNLKGDANIRLSVEQFPNQFNLRESVDWVATEYLVADLCGCTVRERALALIEIAHPDDREALVAQAKPEHILYPNQIYLADRARLYPAEIATRHTFKDGLSADFRAIKPSDVEDMRRLFYRFSDTSVYYRYFSPIKTMPHAKMQEDVDADDLWTLSIVGLVREMGEGSIIAEARFVRGSPRAAGRGGLRGGRTIPGLRHCHLHVENADPAGQGTRPAGLYGRRPEFQQIHAQGVRKKRLDSRSPHGRRG